MVPGIPIKQLTGDLILSSGLHRHLIYTCRHPYIQIDFFYSLSMTQGIRHHRPVFPAGDRWGLEPVRLLSFAYQSSPTFCTPGSLGSISCWLPSSSSWFSHGKDVFPGAPASIKKHIHERQTMTSLPSLLGPPSYPFASGAGTCSS